MKNWTYYFATFTDSWFIWPAVDVGVRVNGDDERDTEVQYIELRFLCFSWNWEWVR